MRKLFLFAAILLLLSGCAGSYSVLVDSLSSVDASDNTRTGYVLSPAMDGVTEDDLLYKEFSRHVESVLGDRGYKVAAGRQEAGIIILLSYGVSGPKKETTRVPVMGEAGVITTYSLGTMEKHGRHTTYSGFTTYVPVYGVAGYIPVTETWYTRYINLTAYDAREFVINKKEIQLWKTTIISHGGSDDLREVFPAMLVAASAYIATNTGARIEVTIPANHPGLLRLREAGRQVRQP